jgi:glycosyltransferase involved in cell wall biosynthesis
MATFLAAKEGQVEYIDIETLGRVEIVYVEASFQDADAIHASIRLLKLMGMVPRGRGPKVMLSGASTCFTLSFPRGGDEVAELPALRTPSAPLTRRARMRLSVIIPILNEVENVELLYDQLNAVMPEIEGGHEIIFVDDGSTDGTREKLREIVDQDNTVKVIEFRRNYGQTAAMQAGIQFASGDVVVTMDGDLQNDPTDIPMMLEKIDEGYDLVHGWRKNRQDTFINRKLPSKMANWLISKVTGFPIRDLGCTLKAIRREIAQELELYGEMHRFIPILAHQRGARCVEVITQHHPRRFGETKYGISRTVRVVLDLITVKYLLDYFSSPMKLFGRAGIGFWLVAFLSLAATIGMKIFGEFDMTGNPLLLLSGFSAMVGLQFFSMGLLGEVNARIYYTTQPKQNYAVRELVNISPPDDNPQLWKTDAA